ncbi:MAG: Sir2 family NAD-dependent protein deacetylase [Rhodoferax sp.]|nr:Sir2 family NAD-dependent protein deacetylase [Rhodoferax sp.]
MTLKQAAEIVSSADALFICAGAGMGVDSGLPDFRGNEGFWKAYPALKSVNLRFAEVASPFTFAEDPVLAWGFYGHRLQLYRNTQPHQGFAILKKWAKAKSLEWRVFTSNVDGQFQKAGFDESNIYECHGSIHHLQCMDGCSNHIWDAESFKPIVNESTCRLISALPKCPQCDGLARPNVMMFGDGGWQSHRSQSQEDRLENWLSRLADQSARLAVVEVGAGTSIPSVRTFSHSLIRRYGARLVRINLREPQVPNLDHVGLEMAALSALKEIDSYINRF